MTGFAFGKWPIPLSEVFFVRPLTWALVNYKPVVPGHVLVTTRRVVAHLADLTDEEAQELMTTLRTVSHAVQKHYGATALTVSLQDGVHAGQTVPHIHFHILPRRAGDFGNNDDVYPAIDASEAEHPAGEKKSVRADNEERKPRTEEDMAAEAETLRTLFSPWRQDA
ncbi:hypothetical protein CXG81DRAFT_13453 [Caulochytrium protostelioides]|uniref:Bis(5'-adenosyl)-triphosphatase n=1 Tax=Caulochytrium protostelioides TaxID=1555241 RepID=A0A4P9X5G0_9FUNG|nr:hypothetical protein CXG81DRAFT_13453 [Caulochytrium protostelioides]|eukprot:RKP00250.1 hypothetical protein CXG81DRAFT_13453 [Caulochytrium protostelioides]